MTAVETSVLRESHIGRDRRTETLVRSLKHEKTRPAEDGPSSWGLVSAGSSTNGGA